MNKLKEKTTDEIRAILDKGPISRNRRWTTLWGRPIPWFNPYADSPRAGPIRRARAMEWGVANAERNLSKSLMDAEALYSDLLLGRPTRAAAARAGMSYRKAYRCWNNAVCGMNRTIDALVEMIYLSQNWYQ